MAASVTLDDMESFDFSAPLNETIIYDECDEDDESTISLSPADNFGDIDCDLNEYFESKPIVENTDTCITTENNSLQENNNLQLRNIDNVKSNDDHHVHDVRCDEDNSPPPYNEIMKKSEMSKTNLGVPKKRSYIEVISIDKEDSENAKKIKQTEDYLATCDNNKEHYTFAQAPVTNEKLSERYMGEKKLASKDCTTNDDFIEYLKDIFDTISESLILCLQAYNKYLKSVSILGSDSVNQDYKKYYLSLKNRYFHLSYCAIANFILPQEAKKNTAFTKRFLNNTLKYAKVKFNSTYTKQDLEPIYNELVVWAKMKKDLGENQVHFPDIAKLQTPILKKHLSQPSIIPEYSNGQRVNDHQVLMTYRTEPTKEARSRENNYLSRPIPKTSGTSYSYNTKAQDWQEYQTHSLNSKTSLYSSVPAKVSQNTLSFSSPICNMANSPDFQQNFFTKPTAHVNLQDKDFLVHQHLTKSTQLLAVSNMNRRPNTIVYSEHEEYQLHIPEDGHNRSMIDSRIGLDALNTRDYNDHMKYSRPNVPSVLSREDKTSIYTNASQHHHNSHERAFIENSYYQMKNMKSHTMPSHDDGIAPVFHHQYPEDHERTHSEASSRFQHIPNEALNQSTEICRSSVSIDSGFASPLQFNVGNDGLSSADTGQMAPIITHVTSLNPKAMQIAEGMCHVCGACTKKKCLGCYQFYYCSIECQILDWQRHKGFCKSAQL